MKKVLFVCVENSCRSQMAEAFAKMHGDRVVKAYSSGSRPSGVVNPKAITAMQRIAYDLSSHKSKSLDEIPQVEYDMLITMGCGDECPNMRAKERADWKIPDPKHMNDADFDKIRDAIEAKVKNLISLFS